MNIITLCGSTNFEKMFIKMKEKLELEGNIVLSLDFFSGSKKVLLDSDTIYKLEQLHRVKIDLSDEIFVINVKGYIGESTKKEIDYAKRKGKKISYLVNNI